MLMHSLCCSALSVLTASDAVLATRLADASASQADASGQ
jgi:hypothetical protein